MPQRYAWGRKNAMRSCKNDNVQDRMPQERPGQVDPALAAVQMAMVGNSAFQMAVNSISSDLQILWARQEEGVAAWQAVSCCQRQQQAQPSSNTQKRQPNRTFMSIVYNL